MLSFFCPIPFDIFMG
jgi:hypothetical protein